MANHTSMRANSTATTRSVALGVLLALVSAGCLVAFSFVAGSADDARIARVAVSSPESDVEPFVLGTRFKNDKKGSDRRSDRGPDPRPARARGTGGDPAVLGTRFKSGTDRDGDKNPPSPPAPSPSPDPSPCGCSTAPPQTKNSPNGNAYGFHKDKSSGSNSGLARGHSKQGSGKPKK